MNVLTYEQLKQQLEAREREVEAVAADCARVKVIAIDLAGEAAQSSGEYEALCATINSTPATNAALAAAEARGVEKFIAKKLKQLEAMHPDTHAFGATAMSIRSQINELQAYVVELRGAKHV